MTDSENVELKKRSRRRLVGAAALALLAAIVLPMVMDQEPDSPAQDIQVSIPDRDANASLSRPIAGQSSPYAEPQLAPPPEEQAPADGRPSEPAASPAADAASVKSEVGLAGALPATVVPGASTKENPPPQAQPRIEAEPATAGTLEAERAKAILEGRAVASGEPSGNDFVVQVGAFSEAGKASAIVADLKRKGFAAYTEKAGAMTRVRIGPFRAREQAEEAARRLGASGMSAAVMSR